MTERLINVSNITFEELKEALKRLDEVTLLELLGLQSDDLAEGIAIGHKLKGLKALCAKPRGGVVGRHLHEGLGALLVSLEGHELLPQVVRRVG